MKKTAKIIGTIFILLLLIFSSMPGVQASSSQSSGSDSQAISPQASEPRAKVSALLSLQVGAKVRCQQVPPTADELNMMKQTGMRTEDLGMQRIFIHLAQELTAWQIDELEAMGITPYPDSWIPPVGDYPTGFIVADMPVDKLDELAGKDYAMRLDTAEQVLEPQNDLAAIKINADDVWTSGYDGTEVRIAVLDSGLDTAHPDIPAPVASKDYSEWPVLDDTIANTVTGHGTHVTGSALGRGTQSAGATHQYKGMAPDADLVFLKIGKDANGKASLDAMINAIKAAVDTYDADIITMSYGGWGSYHDGTRQTAQAVDYAFGKGAVVFISAGNEAINDKHYSGMVNANSTTGFIQVNVTGSNGGNAGLGFNLVWYDGLANSNDLVLEYYASDQTPLADTWASAQEESWKGTEHELSGYGPDAGWYYYLPAGALTYYLKVTNNSDNNQFFHIYFEGIASSGASVKFQNPDAFYTLSSPADAEKAIAVGAYTTRKNWTNYAGTTYWYINPEQTVDTMTSFSSRGPRVDSGAPQKPNIVAPGSAIISVRDTDIYTWPGTHDSYIIDNDGLNLDGSGPADYYVMQGTSMACPTAAGAAALLLEAKPELKGHPADVRNLLQSTATSVEANDNIDGYGLLDIQAALAANASELEADWLFMVYLDADNNLESAGIDDLNEMEVAGSTDDVKIVVEMDRAERDWDDDTSNGNWTGAKRFYVTQDTDAAIINSPVIADLGEVNMGDPATLQSFIEWAIANYPAKHYALVLWDHGSGWRERNTTAMKSICVDDQAGDELTMTELRSALNAANATTGKVLDIIGFDACLMEMVEVVYQVMGSADRPLVDIAVGSEETEPGDGWDYAHTLTALTADPAMTPAQLATQIVNDYVSSYSSTWDITQSAANLDLIDELATAIDSFAQAMTSATGDWSAIKTARSQAQEYYYEYYIDLYHFAQLVNQDTSISQAVRDAASAVMTAVSNAVIAEGHTSSVADSHGLSIYYPETVTDYFSDYETSVLFTTDTQWDEFLSAILSSPTEPDITVSPTSFDVTLAPDTTQDYTLTIGNDGGDTLTYSITDQETTPSLAPGAQVEIPTPEAVEPIEHVATGESSEERTGVVPVTPSYDQRTPAEVALFKDSNPWYYTAIEDILTAHETTYDVYNSSQMGIVDLSPYKKVITASVQGNTFWNALEANKAWFESYVNNGGVLEMHLCAYSGSNSPGKVYPGGFVFYHTDIELISIVDSAHLVVNTPNTITDAQLDNWDYSAHGWFDAIPAGGDVVLKSTTNDEPVWVETVFGSGYIFATTQTVEWRAGAGYPEFLENMTVYTPETDCSWLDENPKSGSVAAGDSDIVTVSIDTTGLAEGNHSAEIVITSNDPDEASTTVPVTLQVSPTEPDITVSPTSFDVTLSPNSTQDYTLTIGNDGGTDLTYDISDQETTSGQAQTATESSPAAEKEQMLRRSPDLVLTNSGYDMSIAVADLWEIGRYTEATADEKLLLYGYPYAGTSYMTVRLDGSDYYQDYTMDTYVTQAPTIDGDSIVAQWSLPTNVEVSQRLTSQSNTTQYRVTVTNNDATSHEVKIRFLLDTMLAYNDGAPFIVPGVGNVTTEQEHANPVFDYWKATDDLVNPTLTSNCTFDTSNKPYKVQFAYWPDIYSVPFDYAITSGQSITWDTAVGMYWNLGTLSSGEAKNVIFYYGTTGAIIGTPEVSIVTLFTDTDSYLPGEDVTIYVDVGNGGDAALVNGNVAVSVQNPEGVSVFEDSSAITVEAGAVVSQNFTYTLSADAIVGQYTVTANVYDADESLLDEATATFTVSSADCSWLDENPKSGTVAAGSSDSITVTIDTAGLAEGNYSAEIVIASNDPDEASTTVPVTLQISPAEAPTVTSVSPNSGEQGATLEVTIGGTNFTGATAVSFGDGITVNSFTVVSTTQITANISISATATAGSRDVSVTTPDGTGTLADGFTVVATGVVVSIDAPDEAAPDSDFTADVNISEVVDFDSCNYDVSFDASVLRLDNVTSGLIGSTTIPVDLYNEISSGTYRIIQNVSGMAGVSGSGYLAVLHFHVIGSEGTSSSISLSNGMLANNLAEEIAATWTGDSVDVVIPPVSVSIDAPDEAAPNSDFTANVNISEVVDFDACNYDVSFDASVLRLNSVTSGLIGSTPIPVDMYIEISSGTYRIIQNVPGLTGVSGSGYLAVLHFHVIGSGGDSSAISLSNGMLANNLAEEIAATWAGDSVDITSVQPGDANGDGNINALDITKVERIIAGLDAETPGADANQDGNINALDITKIERIMVGLD